MTIQLIPAAASVAAATPTLTAGLTFHEILTNIPHDVSAFIVYALMIGSVLLILRAGRSHQSGPPAS